MSGDRSLRIGGDAGANTIVTGDRNRVDSKIDRTLIKTVLPPASNVDIAKELAQIRALLERIGSEHKEAVGGALDLAEKEAHKPNPDKDKVGSALHRALDYAKNTSAFADEVEKLVPHISNAVAWLGSNWHKLLPLVGLVI